MLLINILEIATLFFLPFLSMSLYDHDICKVDVVGVIEV